MLTAKLRHRGESIPYFYAFHRIDTHHRMGDIRIEPIEDRLAPPSRDAVSNDINARAHGIALLNQVLHIGL